jgi:phosphoribosylformylglycinamidine synthase
VLYQIEVAVREDFIDPLAQAIHGDIRDLGVEGVERVKTAQVYLLEGELSLEQAEKIASELLADPVMNNYSINKPVFDQESGSPRVIQVVKKPGVMDSVEESARKALRDIGIAVKHLKTARKYLLYGELEQEHLSEIGSRVLANEVIEDLIYDTRTLNIPPTPGQYELNLQHADLEGLSDEDLLELSIRGQLHLNVAEMHVVRDYFKKLGRKPTDCELETIAQTWSEHCVHKTLRGKINYNGELIDNLLKNTIMKVTRDLDKPWCVSVFEDNAGVISFDDNYDVCFKVETHNHPSAIEPYGGAGTGIGGVIRDPLGTGLGAWPVANTDVFCFGEPDYPRDKLPKGTLHPKRVMKGVVAGVRDYGNRMGIPTVNGAVYFDPRYVGNPLVYCGTVGLLKKGKSVKRRPNPGDHVLLVGGRTGRDGIHGVTFASAELTEESESISSGAVQIGNPITEKKTLDTLMQARDRGFYSAITDCGGGGLSSAVGEMGENCGVQVDLEKVPLKYDGLTYTEIWISEAQERMILAVPPEKLDEILEIFAAEEVEATVIGQFTENKHLHLRYNGQTVANLDMEFLHNGVPRIEREALWEPAPKEELDIAQKNNYGADLKAILSSYNVASKEWIIRQYDHEVQGASVIKPLTGLRNDGPSDAAVIAPVFGSTRGLVISCGMNPKYSDIDPYHMAASAIDEALRNQVAVGGSLDQVALLDNFSWGNTNKPDRLGAMVRAARACYDMAKVFGTPFVSGKDSLNNEYQAGGKTIVIPHTLLMSALGVIDDVTKCVTMDFKARGNLVYLTGLTKPELGGSHYYALSEKIGNSVPEVDAESAKRSFETLSAAIQSGLVKACHDLSEGGLGVALAEMAFAGEAGAEVRLDAVPYEGGDKRDDFILFSESNSRFLVEVEPGKKDAFEKALNGVVFAEIGKTTEADNLIITGLGGEVVVSEKLADLKTAWKQPLSW